MDLRESFERIPTDHPEIAVIKASLEKKATPRPEPEESDQQIQQRIRQAELMRDRLMRKLKERKDQPAPEERRLIDHGKKAEGINAFGKEDGFTGQMQELRVMLADLDQEIEEKTGKESNLRETLLGSVFEMIRKQLSEV